METNGIPVTMGGLGNVHFSLLFDPQTTVGKNEHEKARRLVTNWESQYSSVHFKGEGNVFESFSWCTICLDLWTEESNSEWITHLQHLAASMAAEFPKAEIYIKSIFGYDIAWNCQA